MNKPICGYCFGVCDKLIESPCYEKPELNDNPVGMYHCPDCGMMIVAGMKHQLVCEKCYNIIKKEMEK